MLSGQPAIQHPMGRKLYFWSQNGNYLHKKEDTSNSNGGDLQEVTDIKYAALRCPQREQKMHGERPANISRKDADDLQRHFLMVNGFHRCRICCKNVYSKNDARQHLQNTGHYSAAKKKPSLSLAPKVTEKILPSKCSEWRTITRLKVAAKCRCSRRCQLGRIVVARSSRPHVIWRRCVRAVYSICEY